MKSPASKTITVLFEFRKLGNRFFESKKELISVESDSTEEEIKQQIRWHYNKFIDSSSIVEEGEFKIIE